MKPHLLKIAVGIIAIILCSCQANTQQGAEGTIDHKDSMAINTYAFKTTDGWGYSIVVDNKVFIKQSNIPAIQGWHSFSSEADALKVGNLVLSKIKQKQKPTVHLQELKNMRIIK